MTDVIEEQFSKLPPHSIESEMCLIGALLLDFKMIPLVRGNISKEKFFNPDHGIMFGILCEMFDAEKRIDGVTLRTELERRQLLHEVGGTSYIAEILSSVPSSEHARQYASDVHERWAMREMIGVSNDMIRRSYGAAHGESWRDIAGAALNRLAKLHGAGCGERVQKLGDILVEVYAQMDNGGIPTVPSGFDSLDDVYGGFGLGEMCLIGARPSMGKSTLVKQIALRAARAGVPSAIISLEESNAKIGRNILASESRVDNNRIRKPKFMGENDWKEVAGAISRLSEVPVYATDRARRLDEIHAEASLLVSRHGVQLLIIDYLQRVITPGKDRYERASNASEGVSNLIKELNVAGVIPVQLNRGVEGRDDKRPGMSDLRDSGQLEQDADGIIFLHREDAYHLGDPNYQKNEEAELVIAKNRDGLRGKIVRLRSNLRHQTFEDVIPQGDAEDVP